jgi:hypothetical protein
MERQSRLPITTDQIQMDTLKAEYRYEQWEPNHKSNFVKRLKLE